MAELSLDNAMLIAAVSAAFGCFGITGVGAAIANAVFNATGKRIRDLPITLDKLLSVDAVDGRSIARATLQLSLPNGFSV